MDRRRFLAAIGGALAAPPARAQPVARVARIAILVDGTAGATGAGFRVFQDRMRELGWRVGENLRIDFRYSGGVQNRLPALAAELVALEPDVAAPMTTTAARAMMRATSSIPIVFFAAGDPVGAGLVPNLARPGGNATGQSIMSAEISGKWMEILAEIVPGARKFAFLGQTSNPGITPVIAALQESARARNFTVSHLDAASPEEIDRAFAHMVGEKFDAFMVASAPVVLRHRQKIVDLAARHRVPGAYAREEYVEAGGLLSYSVDRAAQARRTAEQVHRVLEGAKPGDLPVEQPTRITLSINLKAARALGLTVPQSLLLRADRVIE